MKIPKSVYTPQFKAQAVKHAQAVGLAQSSLLKKATAYFARDAL